MGTMKPPFAVADDPPRKLLSEQTLLSANTPRERQGQNHVAILVFRSTMLRDPFPWKDFISLR
jgi:hypothetical protein